MRYMKSREIEGNRDQDREKLIIQRSRIGSSQRDLEFKKLKIESGVI
jgi:hypothetical protein